MKQSQLFYKSSKEIQKDAEAISHQLLLRAGFIDQLVSGVYSFLPLGNRVQQKIAGIIRDEMKRIDGQEVFLPALQPKSLWEETGRWESFDPPLFKVKDRHEKELCLGSTHEEVITDLARRLIKSYRDLPQYLFQIQDKFRNEMRATGGLLRTREFLMKDLYSFHVSKEDAIEYYGRVTRAYIKIFRRCGLSAIQAEADSGTIGGNLSHEFQVVCDIGEDRTLVCGKCGYAANIEKSGTTNICQKCKADLREQRTIEVGHTFFLDTKYSKAMKANFIDSDGQLKPIMMGCYGIGLGRLMATIAEVNHDEKGIIWPKEVAPFKAHIIPVDINNKKVRKTSETIYKNFENLGLETLYDDRQDKTIGEKFAEADLIGIPLRMVISDKTLKKNSIEFKKRGDKKVSLVRIKQAMSMASK